ncbi:MAG: DUF1667 domain-containing protein [Thermoguttaceae bacterium]|nr:DUF1667 domain-containing protein [Thermoguttaceae bacterium]MBR2585897.1 DUF1667 domain-containing protein [Thermoguttaceae bacterium]MBR3218757.1 DUF1667 domain-containing protein [Thermoguttaceae bacterium]
MVTFTCITCPRGCRLEVDPEKKTVAGNLCPRGETYGLAEACHPVRVLTSTVAVRTADGAPFPEMLPVRTQTAIPKGLLSPAMDEIRAVTVTLPVKMGDVLKENIAGSAVALIASRSLG